LEIQFEEDSKKWMLMLSFVKARRRLVAGRSFVEYRAISFILKITISALLQRPRKRRKNPKE